MLCLSLLAVDPSQLGRIDPSLMSEESLLETFFGGVENKDIFTDSSGNFDFECYAFDYGDDGIVCITIDASDYDTFLGGTIHFAFMPQTLEGLSLEGNKMHGSIAVESWSPRLIEVHLNENRLHGQIDTTKLPAKLLALHVEDNLLDGPFETKNLPQ